MQRIHGPLKANNSLALLLLALGSALLIPLPPNRTFTSPRPSFEFPILVLTVMFTLNGLALMVVQLRTAPTISGALVVRVFLLMFMTHRPESVNSLNPTPANQLLVR